MRGPGLRLDLDVRRLWTCPACQRQRRLLGDVPSPLCPCQDGGVIMQLTADSRLLRRAERLTPLPYIKQPLPDGWEQRKAENIAAMTPVPGPVPEPVPVPIPEPNPQPIPDPGPVPFPDPVPGPRAEAEPADDFGGNLGLDSASAG